VLAIIATTASRVGIVDFEMLWTKSDNDAEGYDDHIRSEIKCESKGCSEKNECEVREDANWHIRFERWHNLVKMLNAIRRAEQEENEQVSYLHGFVRFQRVRHGWLC
jgi:hypothetical protein